MTIEILGRREDQRLELKSGRALDEPSSIAREVVGMLNAGGGEIWIGVEDEDEVAVAIEPVPDPERAKARFLDHLVDSVDPSPTSDEVSVEVVPGGADRGVLVVRVRPSGEESGRTPYAFRKRGGWHFLRRVGARNHPMSRQEVFGRFVQGRGDEAAAEAIRELEQARNACRDRGESGLWLGIQPARGLHLDPEDPLFERMVLEPAVTRNRPTGWHFARSSRPPKPFKHGVEWGLWDESAAEYASRTRVLEDGGLRFWVRLDVLARGSEEREIGPLPLVEYSISAFRIARVAYQAHLEPEDRLVADLALLGAGGWGLRRGTPGDRFAGDELSRLEEPDLLWEPVVFTFREIEEAPDRCGFRLVRRIYHAFGWRESDMPRHYDHETGRLILPE